MLLDTFTVIAQLINFLILVWLLKRFLYAPLLDAIDKREQRLRDRQQEALNREQQASALEEQLTAEREELARNRQQRLDEARQDAEALKQRLADEVRREVDNKRQLWHQQLCAEQEAESHRISQHIEQELLSSLHRMLLQLADRSLEQQSLRAFLTKLEQLDDATRQSLTAALSAASSPPRLVTAHPLPPEEQQALQHQLTQLLACDSITFETDADLLCGAELLTDGHKISWTLASQLEDLSDHLRQVHRSSPSCDSSVKEA
jgi:F-type H+-transporting ATPase subunit b